MAPRRLLLEAIAELAAIPGMPLPPGRQLRLLRTLGLVLSAAG